MKKIPIIFMLVFTGCLFTKSNYAEVRLPAIISSNMVLQRITLWGWVNARAKLCITTSWLKNSLSFSADNAGDREVEDQTANSNGPQKIRIRNSKQDISLEKIFFGEVWLCSGQSTMKIFVSSKFGQTVYGAQEAITNSNSENIRLFTVQHQAGVYPREKLSEYTGWQSANLGNVRDFSAEAYFFGLHLQDLLDVPVGLTHTSWRDSQIETRISKEKLSYRF